MTIIKEIKKIEGLREHQIEICQALKSKIRGIVVSPTGSGKTVSMMEDSKRFLSPGNVIVVVCPRHVLCDQLFDEFDSYLHNYDFNHREISCRSKTLRCKNKRVKVQPKEPTTKSKDIAETYRIAKKHDLPLILFCTYNSLKRLVDSEIPITVVYFDESHNSVKSNFFPAVKKISKKSKNCYFFTATPRYTTSRDPKGPGMNNESVYGEIITTVSYKYLVDNGYLLRPFIHLQKSNACIKNAHPEQVDFDSIKENVNYYENNFTDASGHKILYCMKGTKNIKDLIGKTKFQEWATEKGYNVLSVDSKNGGYCDGESLSRESFLEKLKELGEDPDKKLLVLHYEMISEGVDISGFTGVCFMRPSLNTTFITQTIGRCVRTAGPWKKYGYVSIIEHEDDTSEVSSLTKKIVFSLLEHGIPLDSVITEATGRGESEEVLEDLENSFKKHLKEVQLNWEHTNLLQFFEDKIQKEEDKFIDEVF
jgi:predicted helicase